MPTDVVNFAGVYYAATYRVQGDRIVVLGTHQSDRAGLPTWLKKHGHARYGAYLFPSAGTVPGFYVKPYVSDLYYRIDPATRQADGVDAATEFGEPATVTEQNGFGGE